MFSDAHAHLSGSDLDVIVSRAETNDVNIILTAGINLQSSIEAVKVAERYTSVYACVGIHPWNADTFNQDSLMQLRDLTREAKVIAISEIGLDFVGRMDLVTWKRSEPLPRQIQLEAFQEQLKLAKDVNLPVILHCNAAHSEVLEILKREGRPNLTGVIHGFNGSLADAQNFVDLGYYLSIGRRSITAPDNVSIQEVVKEVSLEKLLLETDSGEPADVKEVAEKLALWKGISVEEVGRTTTLSLQNLLRL